MALAFTDRWRLGSKFGIFPDTSDGSMYVPLGLKM